MAKQERWAFRLPNNAEGDQFLKDMRKYLNKDSYKIYKHYTGPRPKGTSPYSTTKENAISVRLYVESKRADDNINPYEYIQRGRDIEKGQQALKNARVENLSNEWESLEQRLINAETELAKIRTLLDWRR